MLGIIIVAAAFLALAGLGVATIGSFGGTNDTLTTPTLSGNTTISDGGNIVVGTSTGTQIGTASNQKIGFYGLAALTQPAGNGTQATAAAGSTTTIFANTTLTGGSGSTAYTVGDIVLCLKKLGLIQT